MSGDVRFGHSNLSPRRGVTAMPGGGSVRVASPVQGSLSQRAGAVLGSPAQCSAGQGAMIMRPASSPVMMSPGPGIVSPRRHQSPSLPSMAAAAAAFMKGAYPCGLGVPLAPNGQRGSHLTMSPPRMRAASPQDMRQTQLQPQQVQLSPQKFAPQMRQVMSPSGIRRAPSPAAPAMLAAMQRARSPPAQCGGHVARDAGYHSPGSLRVAQPAAGVPEVSLSSMAAQKLIPGLGLQAEVISPVPAPVHRATTPLRAADFPRFATPGREGTAAGIVPQLDARRSASRPRSQTPRPAGPPGFQMAQPTLADPLSGVLLQGLQASPERLPVEVPAAESISFTPIYARPETHAPLPPRPLGEPLSTVMECRQILSSPPQSPPPEGSPSMRSEVSTMKEGPLTLVGLQQLRMPVHSLAASTLPETQPDTLVEVSPVTTTKTILPSDSPNVNLNLMPQTPDQPNRRDSLDAEAMSTLRPRVLEPQLAGSTLSFAGSSQLGAGSPIASTGGFGVPEYTSAKLLPSSASKLKSASTASTGTRNRRSRNLSPGPAPVVLPPRPQSPSTNETLPRLFADGGAKSPRAAFVVSAAAEAAAAASAGSLGNAHLFGLFSAALADHSIAEEACRALLASCLGANCMVHWAEIAHLHPTQTLARVVACALPGSGQALQDETPWRQALGEEEECKPWWTALLARHGVCGRGDTILAEEFGELVVSAFRMLRDRYAPQQYLRNLRIVRAGAHRLRDRYDSFRFLSSGTLGRTFRCRSRLSFEERLCSQLRKDWLYAPADQIRAEAETLRSIEHPHLPRVVEHFEDFNNIYVISELVDSIKLPAFFRTRQTCKAQLSEAWLAQVVRQVLDVLRHIHELKPHSVVHGDLRMDSIGLASIADACTSPHVIITDLGLAGLTPSPPRAPPEGEELSEGKTETRQEYCSPKRDVWSCGCLMYMLLAGCPPCASSQSNDIYFGGPLLPPVSEEDIDWTLLRHCSSDAEILCEQMLQWNPVIRPSAAQCLGFRWVQPGYDAQWNKLVPLDVLDGLVKLQTRADECQEVVHLVVEELGSGPLSCASKRFADAVAPPEIGLDGTPDALSGVTLKALQAADLLLHLGVSVLSIEKVMHAFALDRSGTIAYGRFVKSCMDLAEDQLDRALWRTFVAANEDYRGILCATKLEQVLDGGWALDGSSQGPDGDSEGLARNSIKEAMDPELTASEAVRQIAQGGNEVTFLALKEFIVQRHNVACASTKSWSGMAAEPLRMPADPSDLKVEQTLGS